MLRREIDLGAYQFWGGLAVALAESCISQQIGRNTPKLIGAQIDLTAEHENSAQAVAGNGATSVTTKRRLDALLFGETQGRIVITTSALNAVKVVERAKLLGVSAARIGTVGGDKVEIQAGGAGFVWPVAELHDLWWNSIARAMG